MKKKSKYQDMDLDSFLKALDQEIVELDYLSGIYSQGAEALREIEEEEARILDLLESESPESLLKAQALLETLSAPEQES